VQVNLNKSGRWLVGLLYFKRDVDQLEYDEAGDTIIRELVPQLERYVNRSECTTHFTWLRYSQGGNHLRMQFWVTSETEMPRVERAIRDIVDSNIQRFPEYFSGDMELTPMMERLRLKTNEETLYSPGTFLFGPMFDTGEESVYESEACFHAVQAVLSADSRLCAAILQRLDDYRERATVSNLFALSTLSLVSQSFTEKTALGMYVMQTWSALFGITKQDLSDSFSYYQSKLGFFQQQVNSPEANIAEVRKLDQQLGDLFKDTIDTISGILSATPLNSQTWEILAMQGLTIMHQNYNRLGISMLDEISFAAFIYQSHANLPSTDLPLARQKAQQAVKYWEQARV